MITPQNSKFIVPKKMDKSKPIVLIYNPVAGRNKMTQIEQIKNKFESKNMKVVSLETTEF
jgi:diacylglycerol kinase (ATP)